MSFDETSCHVEYDDKYTGPPHCYYRGGDNVSVDCVRGSIQFRKDPTGILLHKEDCRTSRELVCQFCSIIIKRRRLGNRLVAVDRQSDLANIYPDEGDVVYVTERVSDFVYTGGRWVRVAT
jgi:hypothetical protein